MGKPLAPRNRNEMFHSNCLRCFDVTEYGEYSNVSLVSGIFSGRYRWMCRTDEVHMHGRHGWECAVCVCVWYRSSDVMQMIHLRTKSLSKMKLEFSINHSHTHRNAPRPRVPVQCEWTQYVASSSSSFAFTTRFPFIANAPWCRRHIHHHISSMPDNNPSQVIAQSDEGKDENKKQKFIPK